MHGNSNQLDTNSMRDFVQKNSLERVAHEKKTKNLEHQKKAFVRQYSKDEQEIKNILQRLHVEQQIYDGDGGLTEPELIKADIEVNDTPDVADEVFVNPYPVTITPKFGQASTRQGSCSKKNGGEPDLQKHRLGRRKSLEFEDITTTGSVTHIQHGRYSVSGSPSSIGRIRKLSNNSDHQPELCDIWAGDPEFISSVRRPRKTSSDINHRRLLQRAMSDFWTYSSNSESLARLSIIARKSSTDDVSCDSFAAPSVDRDRKKSLGSELSHPKEEDARQKSTDNKISSEHASKSPKKLSIKKVNKMDGEIKESKGHENEENLSESKENDWHRGKSHSESSACRTRRIGRVEHDITSFSITDTGTEVKEKKKILKKKMSMPEMKIGMTTTTTTTKSFDDSSKDPNPRARHGSLKEKNRDSSVKTRPRNGSFT